MRKENNYRLDLNKSSSKKDKFEKFVNYLMFDGKKERAEKTMREILYLLKKKYQKNPFLIFGSIFRKMDTPVGLEKPKRRGGLKVPKLLTQSRRFFQGIYPIVKEAKKIKGSKWSKNVFKEVEKVHLDDSPIVQRMKEMRDEVYKCRANGKRMKRRFLKKKSKRYAKFTKIQSRFL